MPNVRTCPQLIVRPLCSAPQTRKWTTKSQCRADVECFSSKCTALARRLPLLFFCAPDRAQVPYHSAWPEDMLWREMAVQCRMSEKRVSSEPWFQPFDCLWSPPLGGHSCVLQARPPTDTTLDAQSALWEDLLCAAGEG